ncbi:11803_t:CDS:10 [Entrophospora sp. SA101]|nr:11803_t:CDS:10 [Entrophospora sp. SA101]
MQENLDSNCLSIDNQEIITRSPSPTPLRSLNRLLVTDNALLNKPIHTIKLCENSILSLACSNKYLFSGSQGSCIQVWDLINFQQAGALKGHTGSILCLSLSSDQSMLFSSSGDGTVRIWNADALKCLYVIQSSQDVGDIFSVVYSDKLKTLYIGCQNTSIQRFDLSIRETFQTPHLPNIHNYSKFFDSLLNTSSSNNGNCNGNIEDVQINFMEDEKQGVKRYEICDDMIYLNSHNGYVYALALGANQGGDILISGSGDGDIKIWSIKKSSMNLLRVLGSTDASILTLALQDELLICGTQGGDIKIYDLETYQHIRSLMAHNRWNKTFNILDTYNDHNATILSLTMSPLPSANTTTNTKLWLISGTNDKLIKFWDLSSTITLEPHDLSEFPSSDLMIYALSKWISLQTISGNSKYSEECLRGAKYLKSIMEQLGANSSIIPGGPGQNPLVFGRFLGNENKSNKLNILVYGHYDVIAADETEWSSSPFKMSGKDGYLYGRGPMLSAIFAASELLQEKRLEANVSFLIEGEEENGSKGFYEAVEQSKDLIGEADIIIVSNSYWLDDETPCLTYGLRGIGGAVSEPLKDMIKILSKLVPNDNKVMIPEFYDKVREVTTSEKKIYESIIKSINRSKLLFSNENKNLRDSLMLRWRYPSLTIHKIDVSGPIDNTTVISHKAEAILSMRIVPDQNINDIIKNFQIYVNENFEELRTDNCLKITINNMADWWLGDPENKYFKAAEEAIEQEWGIKPLYIREGGSIPAVSWLEKRFNAITINLPIGQSSDQAHLKNERIRLQNLYAGKRIFKNLFNNFNYI